MASVSIDQEQLLACFREDVRMVTLYQGLPMNRASCLHHLGTALVANGSLAEGRRALRRAAREYRAVGNLIWAAVAQLSLARSLKSPKDLGRRLQIAEEALTTLQRNRSTFHEVAARLVLAETQMRTGHSPVLHLQVAHRRTKSHGYIAYEWQVYYLRARWVGGRAALKHYRQMLRSMLQARWLTSSTTSMGKLPTRQNAGLARLSFGPSGKSHPKPSEGSHKRDSTIPISCPHR